MKLAVQTEQEEDGRWIAEIPQIPGVLAYGSTREEAISRAEELARHCEILAAREKRIASGEAHFSDWQQAKEEIRRRVV